jgi:hypothetical protein
MGSQLWLQFDNCRQPPDSLSYKNVAMSSSESNNPFQRVYNNVVIAFEGNSHSTQYSEKVTLNQRCGAAATES